jgi:hypothetical protein
MYRLITLIAFFALSVGTTLTAQNVSERNPPTVTPTQYFQSRLEKLYVAINQKENNNISRYETDLLGMMRTHIETAQTSTEKKKYSKRMEEILTSFEGFSFVTAEKDAADAHLALLEEFLAMLN